MLGFGELLHMDDISARHPRREWTRDFVRVRDALRSKLEIDGGARVDTLAC